MELKSGCHGIQIFTKYGRVNYVLERRLMLLDEVQRLADTLGVKVCRTHLHWLPRPPRAKVANCKP